MKKFKHISVDLETLGVTADSVILSIGACRFDLDGIGIDDEAFYASISVDSNLDLKRYISEDTLLWWLKRGQAAQNVFHEPKTTFEAAFCDFTDWVGTDDNCMWSMGADFDLPMLAHGYKQLLLSPPWKFWNSRCVRTYKNLPQAQNINLPRQGTHHNALDDAIYQAQLVQAIQRVLTGKKAVIA
jgi:hypothetical protein